MGWLIIKYFFLLYLIDRLILLLFHFKFWNTTSIGIPVRSPLQGRLTSNWFLMSAFPFQNYQKILCLTLAVKHGVETWIEVTIILVNLDTGGYNKSWDSNIAAWVVLINLDKKWSWGGRSFVFALILSQIPKQMNTREKNNSKYQQEAKKSTESITPLLNWNKSKMCFFPIFYFSLNDMTCTIKSDNGSQ